MAHLFLLTYSGAVESESVRGNSAYIYGNVNGSHGARVLYLHFILIPAFLNRFTSNFQDIT